MSTRATIEFTDGDEIYYVYRGHDGFPKNILQDIKACIEKSKGRWSNPELGTLVTLMLAMHWDWQKTRLPDYEMTSTFHGDDSYRYYVKWNGKEYEYGVRDNS